MGQGLPFRRPPSAAARSHIQCTMTDQSVQTFARGGFRVAAAPLRAPLQVWAVAWGGEEEGPGEGKWLVESSPRPLGQGQGQGLWLFQEVEVSLGYRYGSVPRKAPHPPGRPVGLLHRARGHRRLPASSPPGALALPTQAGVGGRNEVNFSATCPQGGCHLPREQPACLQLCRTHAPRDARPRVPKPGLSPWPEPRVHRPQLLAWPVEWLPQSPCWGRRG